MGLQHGHNVLHRRAHLYVDLAADSNVCLIKYAPLAADDSHKISFDVMNMEPGFLGCKFSHCGGQSAKSKEHVHAMSADAGGVNQQESCFVATCVEGQQQ